MPESLLGTPELRTQCKRKHNKLEEESIGEPLVTWSGLFPLYESILFLNDCSVLLSPSAGLRGKCIRTCWTRTSSGLTRGRPDMKR